MRIDPAHDSLHKLELQISHFLRWGVLVSGAFLFVGWIWMLLQTGYSLNEFTHYKPVPFLESFQISWATGDYSHVFALLGLVILVSLPIMRVFLTAVLFVRQQDRILAFIAFFVFFFLIASLLLGLDK